MRKVVLFTLICLLGIGVSLLRAQAPKRWTSGEIHEAIQKLNFLGSVLYVAAHPDDENTGMIAYMSNEVKANTAYLSMTRGDGGQNLIGPEIRDLLGLIRTQELLAARRVDGGNQFFTRANDFGFSKNPDETFNIWNKQEVLADVVWAIRKWQPDVIINRFDHRTSGTTHGHHTASAILSVAAYDLAGDPKAFPEQLSQVKTWQPSRQFFNTSWWFYGSQEAFKNANKDNLVSFDVGVYYPIKGKSNNEIAAESRSMHKCQGMGMLGSRGSTMEYLELLRGSMPANGDVFTGINTTWSRVPGGEPIGKILAGVEREFRYDQPWAVVPQLMQAAEMLDRLPDGYWKRVKSGELKTVIQACLGLFAEVIADDYSATAGQQVNLAMELVNRSPVSVVLTGVSLLPMGLDSTLQMPLENNQRLTWKQPVTLPTTMDLTTPYWLRQPGTLGLYHVANQTLRGLPETPRDFKVRFHLQIAGKPLNLDTEVTYKYDDPVRGEVYRPFEIIPPVAAHAAEKVYVFANSQPQSVNVIVRAGRNDLTGTVSLQAPEGWEVQPSAQPLTLGSRGEEKTLRFTVTPPNRQSQGKLLPVVTVDGQAYSNEMKLIQYDHIPVQTVLTDAASEVVRIDLRKEGERIGYLMGAGDEIPASLQQMGYQVSLLNVSDLTVDNLARYDAVVLGIRAYNTADGIQYRQEDLFEYVRQGGTLVVQYNNNFDLKLPAADLPPFPLKLSRERVTVEDAPVRFLAPEHPVLNFPNKITEADFANWVQERGLYFPGEWSADYTAILSCHDPGEKDRDGGLLVAKMGKGYYIYTGYSWFRQLPAGVPGAFRLFANMVSIGKAPRP